MFIIISYNSSFTDVEHSPNYTTFSLLQIHKVRFKQVKANTKVL